MKKTLAAASILLIAAMASCGSDEKKDNSTFTFETYKFHETVRGADNDSVAQDIVDFDGIWDCEGAGVMPVALGTADIKALQDTLGALANVTIHDRKVTFSLPDYLRPLEAKADSTQRGGSTLRKELTLDYMSDEMAVFRAYTYAYPQGAAHGIYSNRYVNYDLRDSRVLHLSDILVPGAEKEMHSMVVERLKERYDLIVSPEEVELPDNFKLTADGIDFVFPLYSVVPYSDGEAEVSFAAYEIDTYLTPIGRALLLPDAD